MFTQFFGNYLLNENYLTIEQLSEGLRDMKESRAKFGVLAMNAGYLTGEQVEFLHQKQMFENKRIGDLAVDMGYITKEQVEELLSRQPAGYLMLGQALVDKGYITNIQFSEAINDYKNMYSLSEKDLTQNHNDKLEKMLSDLYLNDEIEEREDFLQYITLLFNNIVRFIGDDFIPLEVPQMADSSRCNCAYQEIQGQLTFKSVLEGEASTLLQFAARYAGDDFVEVDEYVSASAEDFLNLINGLFAVNMSNEKNIELKLLPPGFLVDCNGVRNQVICCLPIGFSFGTINFVLSR